MLTFEDRRKENFEKGQAELERRRAMLREQQQKEEEARVAAEKAEFEKRERLRSVVMVLLCQCLILHHRDYVFRSVCLVQRYVCSFVSSIAQNVVNEYI